jgi:hypothetical protein
LFSSGGAQLELRLGFGGERLLTVVITHHAEYMGVYYMGVRELQ